MRSSCARLVEPLESRVHFNAVTRLTLINADTDKPIAGYDPIPAGAVLNLATLPTRRLNVKATVDSTAKSVRFGLDAKTNYSTESSAPFALAGDNNGNFNAWTPTVGSHKLTATPFSATAAGGTAGRAVSVSFSVVNPGGPATTPTPTPTTPGGFARTYVVSASSQYKTIAAATAVAVAGDLISIAPGRYHEVLRPSRSGQSGKPITFAAQTAGTVTLDGAGFKKVIDASSATYIVIDGLTIDRAANGGQDDPAAVSTNNGWRLKNLVVQNTDGTGVSVHGNDVQLTKVTAQYNGRAGISGFECSNVLVKDCITRGNNTFNNDPDWDGGAGKWFSTRNVTIDNMTSHGNVGPGIWFDYENTNVVIRNSKSYNNRGREYPWSGNGIRVELNSTGPILIENNTLYGNTGHNLDLQSSRHVTIRGNTFTGSTLALRDWDRGAAFKMNDVKITDNLFKQTGVYTEGGTWALSSPASKAISFDRNRYSGGVSFNWGAATYFSLADVRSKLGYEWAGSTIA